jgi:protein-disulfide isomerase-like protein with CxxC motif
VPITGRLFWRLVPVRVRYLTDPACSWSWAFEPVVRRLQVEFGDELEWTLVMGGLARDYTASGGSDAAEEASSDGWDPYPWLMAHWLEVAAEGGMPCDPLLWRDAPLRSTYPACLAVRAAAEQAGDGGMAYLRAVREGLMCFRRRLDTTEALVEEARGAGLDRKRFRIDLGSHAIVEAFGSDLEEVRDVPDEARELGKVKGSGARERVPFPTLVFAGDGGTRRAIYGYRPYEEVRAAASAAGARPCDGAAPEPLVALRRLGRMATAEVAGVCELPGPRAAAELWRLASEWRVTRVPVLCGELWEAA